MVTKPKSNSVITHEITDDHVVFHVAGAGSINLNMAAVSSEVKSRACLHGMIQRISDVAAISRDPATGQPASPEAKFAAMQALVTHYESGTTEWRTAKSSSGPRTGNLLAALVTLYPNRSMVELAKWLEGKSKAERAALRNSPKVAAILAQSAGGNGDELLDELNA